MTYKSKIENLILNSPLEINLDVELKPRIPTTVSSEFITNREQGDWAEQLVNSSINRTSDKYIAVKYGRSENLSAGEDGFKEFYTNYIDELNKIGKKPDLLIFRKEDYSIGDELNDEKVRSAIAAIEVRSSSFLVNKYESFMTSRINTALEEIEKNRNLILSNDELRNLLMNKNQIIFNYILNSTIDSFQSLNFRTPSWSSSPNLKLLSSYLKEIKDNIKIIQKRDYLSITPKLEDIALVNRWIQHYNVPHYYLQVFFDKAYMISFMDILNISSDSEKEGVEFSIEQDIKNQGKTTIKINIHFANLIIDEITMPNHFSQMKELDRGRLIFYVKFNESEGKLHTLTFEEIVNADN